MKITDDDAAFILGPSLGAAERRPKSQCPPWPAMPSAPGPRQGWEDQREDLQGLRPRAQHFPVHAGAADLSPLGAEIELFERDLILEIRGSKPRGLQIVQQFREF